jgi:hypothetical protein
MEPALMEGEGILETGCLGGLAEVEALGAGEGRDGATAAGGGGEVGDHEDGGMVRGHGARRGGGAEGEGEAAGARDSGGQARSEKGGSNRLADPL